MKLNVKQRRLGIVVLLTTLLLNGCSTPVALVERPETKASEAERAVCTELARSFPTWAFDGGPETVANREDTEASVEEGLIFTEVFEAVCPGDL